MVLRTSLATFLLVQVCMPFLLQLSRHERHFPTPDYVLQEFIFLEILKKRYATLIEVQEILRLDCTSGVSLSV